MAFYHILLDKAVCYGFICLCFLKITVNNTRNMRSPSLFVDKCHLLVINLFTLELLGHLP